MQTTDEEVVSKFDRFKNNYKLRGGDFRQVEINSAINLLNSKFKNDPSYHVVQINDIEGVDCRIYENNSYSKKYGSAYIQTKLDYQLHIGDLIRIEDKYWLCTFAKLENEIYYQGTIIECNYELRWVDDDGYIKSIHCFVDDGSLSVIDNKLVNHPDGKITIQMPITDDTVKIAENKRFLIDIQRPNPNTYKVTGCNFVTKGLGYISLERDVFNPSTDNLDLMIANYYDTEIVEDDDVVVEDDIIELVPKVKIITDSNYAKIGKTLTVGFEFVDAEDSIPVWMVESTASVPYIETPDGLVFEVPYDLSLVGNTIGITLTNSSQQCSDNIVLKIRGVI